MSPDTLAKERTELADERTLLAYVRTSLSLFIFGIAVEQLYSEISYSRQIFMASLVFGILLFVFGIMRFVQSLRKIK